MNTPAAIWRQILDVTSEASDHVLLVAPFVKAGVFADLIAAVRPAVREIRCVTRWSVTEVAAGVSDPEILELTRTDGRIKVDLCHPLHAKIFIGDERALVGSANLTGKATGRVQPENIEILVEVPAEDPTLQLVISRIDAHAVPATEEIAASIRRQADLLSDAAVATFSPGQDSTTPWYPETRSPERLFPVYQGRDHGYSEGVLEGVITDLARLDIRPGLNAAEFADFIRTRLRNMPELTPLLETGSLMASDLERDLRERTGTSTDRARRTAENIAEWLRYFDDFLVSPAGSWEIRQGHVIH